MQKHAQRPAPAAAAKCLLLFNSLIGYYTSFLFQHTLMALAFILLQKWLEFMYLLLFFFLFYLDIRIYSTAWFAQLAIRLRDRLTAGEAVGYERPKFGYRPTITTPFFLFLFCYGQVYSEISRYYCPSDYISILQSWRCRLNWNNIRILLTERLEYFGQPKNGK